MDEQDKPTPEELQFLQDMASIESSNGLDLAHKEVTHGIQKGDTAIGRYGLMPNTIKELAQRMARQKKLAQSLEPVQSLPKEQLAEFITQNPEAEDQLALQLQRHIRSRPGVTTPEQANYMWQYGHNLTGDKLNERKYEESDRAQKFKKLRQLLAKE